MDYQTSFKWDDMIHDQSKQIDESGCLKHCQENACVLKPELEAVSPSIKGDLIRMNKAQIRLSEDSVGKSCREVLGANTRPRPDVENTLYAAAH
jgi:hypothetical protein